MKAIIFDIDGTLSDPTHRLHHVTGGRKDWDAFFAAMADDPAHEPIADLCARLWHGGKDAILFCSGRPERYRDETVMWLRKTAGISWWPVLLHRTIEVPARRWLRALPGRVVMRGIMLICP